MAAPGIVGLLRRNRRLRWFSLGLLVSRIGDAFNGIALAWLALTIGTVRDLGLVLLCAGLPRVPASPIAGKLIDRFNVRTLLIIDNIGRACTVTAVPVLGWLHLIEVWELCAVAAVCGILSTLTDVGDNVVIPVIVADDQLTSANAVVSMTYEASALAGPAAAGLLVQTAGYQPAFLCDAMSFAIMAVAASLLPSIRPSVSGMRHGKSTASSPLSGFHALLRLPIVATMTVVSLVFLLLSGMTEVGWPAFSKFTLHAHASGFGLLMTAAGAGATAGIVILAAPLARLRPQLAVGLVLAMPGIFFFLLVEAKSLSVAMLLAFAAYFAGMSFYTLDRTIVQRAVPPHERGTVLGARRAVTSAGYPLGAAIAGILAPHVGPVALFVGIGVCMCVLAVGASVALSLRAREPAEIRADSESRQYNRSGLEASGPLTDGPQ